MSERVFCPRCKVDITGLERCALCGLAPELVGPPVDAAPVAAPAGRAAPGADERMGLGDICSTIVCRFGDFWDVVGWLLGVLAIAGVFALSFGVVSWAIVAWGAIGLFWAWMLVDVVDQAGGMGWAAVALYPPAVALAVFITGSLWFRMPLAACVVIYMLQLRE